MIYDYQDKSGKNGNLEKVEFYKISGNLGKQDTALGQDR